jgi:hypothetical protein
LLSLGSPGWIQIANFVVSGILYVIGAVGLRAALRSGHGRTWGPVLVGTLGVGLIIAGVFTADPGAGFPPGAPAGAPVMSWHGVLHEVGFMLSFGGAIAACGVLARRYAVLGRRGWMVAALAAPVAALALVGWPDLNTLSVRLVIAAAILLGFLTAVFVQVLQQGPSGQNLSTEHGAKTLITGQEIDHEGDHHWSGDQRLDSRGRNRSLVSHRRVWARTHPDQDELLSAERDQRRQQPPACRSRL